ncbi:hypothetical protein F4809DRAFT_377265 [Biscogniauxia mediterranea]|nr:hypothetical protein F4809DRAFT_377265 [Biscogniauxia mediterranea]
MVRWWVSARGLVPALLIAEASLINAPVRSSILNRRCWDRERAPPLIDPSNRGKGPEQEARVCKYQAKRLLYFKSCFKVRYFANITIIYAIKRLSAIITARYGALSSSRQYAKPRYTLPTFLLRNS